jgi:hypothetical protein
MFPRTQSILVLSFVTATALGRLSASAAENIMITDVPDYTWHAGCFGSASGNLMGFWDRNGFPKIYTGPTAGGVAPLDTFGDNAGVRSLWASKAGFDGRPSDQPGHLDDYWDFYDGENSMSYQSNATDPYILAGRPEHAPDCTGDFMGASQNKWTDLNGECNGNIDAFSFNFWDQSGARRVNFTPPSQNGVEIRDIQSGFRKFAEYCGYQADSFSQLVQFNPVVPSGAGFTFDNLKAEINAGYPMMLFLQNNELSRDLPGAPHVNPGVHGMIAYGYRILDDGTKLVRYRTSWGDGDNRYHPWIHTAFEAGLNLRGVIGFRPKPQIISIAKISDAVVVKWDGPAATLLDGVTGQSIPAHWYILEKATSLTAMDFTAVTNPTSTREALVNPTTSGNAFFRVKLLDRSQVPAQ